MQRHPLPAGQPRRGATAACTNNLRLNISANYRPQPGETWDLRVARGLQDHEQQPPQRPAGPMPASSAAPAGRATTPPQKTGTSLGGKWSPQDRAKSTSGSPASRSERSVRTQVRAPSSTHCRCPASCASATRSGLPATSASPPTRRTNGAPQGGGPSTPASATSRSETRADAAGSETRNTSRVTSPLFHLLWKPEAYPRPGAPQPHPQLLLAQPQRPDRPSEHPSPPCPEGPNYQTWRADRAGNPDLKPELATGIDLSLEHWMPTGGIVSGTAFVRDIKA